MQKQPVFLLDVAFDVAADLFENLWKELEKIIHMQIMPREAVVAAEVGGDFRSLIRGHRRQWLRYAVSPKVREVDELRTEAVSQGYPRVIVIGVGVKFDIADVRELPLGRKSLPPSARKDITAQSITVSKGDRES